ncbi:alanine racemase [Rhodococcus tibetensis]|uniref:Alanine racemase n=1 Tax=Rhodococcus tibetensis TaxID=2965064 RepID=A0ABT1QH43_9NOCA|nr:alanine racemase [Rhodococcus sp. FXJ9.536]MCQ4121578.1 alanine racemase [Rhodococcus sp. FXJ9.536]
MTRSILRSVRLPALTTPWTDTVTADRPLLQALVRGFGGGPVHLLDPAQFARNARGFAAVFDEAGLDGTVYFGKKANKANAFADAVADLVTTDRRAGRSGTFGIDVASVGEFRQALAAGVRGRDLLITGPTKPAELLGLAVRHDAVVTIDSPSELRALAALSDGLGVRVLFRVLPQPAISRFGMNDDELRYAERLALDHATDVAMLGYSFHLSGYSLSERRDQACQLVDRVRAARAQGLAARTISLGGGYPISYVPQDDWQRFTNETAHAFHAGKQFDSYYPYHSAITGAQALRAIVTEPAPGRKSIAQSCQDHGISLFTEPGRALLDRAGITVFPVLGVKEREPGMIVVNGTSLSLSEQWFDTEFLPDPQLVSATTPVADPAPFFASVGAATCLESDMLTWRVIEFPHRPAPGDFLVYHNTAGYQMDSNESAFHDTPIPPKVVITLVDGRPVWELDRPTSN